MSILSNLLLLLLSTSLICAVASDDKSKDVASNAGGPNMNIWGNLSEAEMMNLFKHWLTTGYQRGKNETTSSPILSSQRKVGQKSENETISKTEPEPEPPSKSPIRARLESLMANPNISVEIKSALKLLLTGNTALCLLFPLLFTHLFLSRHAITKAVGIYQV